MTKQISLDLEAGIERKDTGIDNVSWNNLDWSERAAYVLHDLCLARSVITSDSFRLECSRYGLPNPAHPNCWGAIFSKAARAGWIKRTGYQPSELPISHARIISVWESLLFPTGLAA